MNLDLTGKTALITGASKGIGLAIAQVFAREGCNLHLAARNGEAMLAAKAEIKAAHKVKVTVHPLDLSSTKAMEKLAADVGDIDILINNAGDIPAGSLEIVDDVSWRKGFDLKVFGYITLARAFYTKMKGKDGVILNVIGNSGENWDASYIAGSTGNAALMSFTKALGGASLNEGVRVVGVNPGPVATDRMLKIMKRKAIDMLGDEGRWEELFDKYPGKRPATSEEVADLCAFLSSPRAAYITGTVVTIDGGISARGSVI
ncbi:MAG: SDR family oxidoreductase [Alphaproteobacteria bacterium]|nr:SDR family oxidoreductase [Alphaproteobacteria bacterium]MBU0803910.1 SDR family oxidoreductase [Alphaproteobacteria bacterium]MBU0872793.1 SDR family oxidoreductase [Alphaproteobacteria bacterium]MBU1402837.1 SDR family oxidoreductase [Alphaproteobacteria bacterium]MBU1593479.1 SDR family oxidoreductase [Alphaproteobacteria bacterium]